MRSAAIFAATVAASFVATAQPVGPLSFVAESMDGNTRFYLRTDRISKHALGYSVWLSSELKKPGKLPIQANQSVTYTSVASQKAVNCDAMTYADIQITYYDSAGNAVASQRGNPYDQTSPIPDTIGDSILQRACLHIRLYGK